VHTAARSADSGLAPSTIQRRTPRAQDIQIEILYCGVCHSDLHQVRNEWTSVMPTVYPCVPGHEIVGRVRLFEHNTSQQCRGKSGSDPNLLFANLPRLNFREAN
jgi:D-arabinose 1-dehydrogenase-like Zn-dependent alcohol dehydrogenase